MNEVAYGSGKKLRPRLKKAMKRLCCPGVDYKRRLPGGTSKQTRGGTWVAGPGPDAEKGSREEVLSAFCFFPVKAG